MAHSLRTLLAPPPVALLFHMYSSLQRFFSADSTIQVHRLHKELSSSKGFNYELTPSPLTSDAAPDAESPDNNDNNNSLLEQVVLLPPSAPPPPPEHIAILVITTKAPQTVAALRPISKRLTRDFTILILQDGMGVLDEIKAEIFPNSPSRPSFILGITTHGIYPQGGGLCYTIGVSGRYPSDTYGEMMKK